MSPLILSAHHLHPALLFFLICHLLRIAKIFPLTYWISLLFRSQLLVALNSMLSPFPLYSSYQWRAARKRHFVDHPIRKQHPDGLHVSLSPPAKRLLQCLWIRGLHTVAGKWLHTLSMVKLYFSINTIIISLTLKSWILWGNNENGFVTLPLLHLVECVQLCSNLYLVWHELTVIVLT